MRPREGEGNASPRSSMETRVIKNLITSYFNVVRKNINDMVPKTIMAFLVNKSKNNSQKELVAALYSGEMDIDDLLNEDEATKRKREVCKNMIETLKESL